MPETPLLDTLTADWKRLKEQKARQTGGVEARVLQNLAFLHGEHYTNYKAKSFSTEPQDPNKLYLTFNILARRFGKLLGRLSSINPPFKATPDKKDPKALSEAEVVDRLILALDKKLNQPAKTWELLWWLLLGGVAFEHVPWVPNSSIELVPQFGDSGEVLFKDTLTGEILPEAAVGEMVSSGMRPPEHFEVYEEVGPVGEVGSEILGPLNVFLDQNVKSIEELAPDQYVYIAKIRTLGWIEENFDVQVEPDKNFEIVTTQFRQSGDSVGGQFLKDLIPLVQGTAGDDDPPMAVVVEGYGPQSKKNPHGKYCVFIPGKTILHEGENPYGEIPIVDFHFTPVTTSFWTKDYVGDLIAPQRFLNKRLSQLGEQSNAAIYSQLLLGAGLSPEDIPTDFPGAVKNAISDNGIPLVQRLEPPQMPGWYMNSLELVIKLFNDIAGGADLFQENKFPGQLRGPMAVPMLQEILDTEWNNLYQHLGERLGKVKQLRLNRVKQFYPPIRTLHYTDRNQKDEVLTFHSEKVLRSGVNYNITVEPGSLLPELRSLREARVIERLAGPLAILYLDERTGQLDKSKIAADLQFGDAGREGREAQYRKLAGEINEMLWNAQPVPPVLPFYDHRVMMDEMESAMATTEYLKASPQVQQGFIARWEEHRNYLMMEAQAQQMAMQSGMMQNAVAQATQQTAAQVASDTVAATMGQIGAQRQMTESGETEHLVRSAAERGGGQEPRPPKKREFSFSVKRSE